MPIKVKCKCGLTMQAPDEMAGSKGQCPQCNEQFAIPSPSAKPAAAKPAATSSKPVAARSRTPVSAAASNGPDAGGMASLLDEVGVQKARTRNSCPQCRADVQEDAVICIECGMNLESGKRVRQKFHGSVGESAIQSEPTLWDDPKVKYGTLAALALITVGVVYYAITTFAM